MTQTQAYNNGSQRKRRNRRRTPYETIDGARSILRTAARRITDEGDGGLETLENLAELERDVRTMIDGLALDMLSKGHSYREVGNVLGISRQSVERRYPNGSVRPVGGVPVAAR